MPTPPHWKSVPLSDLLTTDEIKKARTLVETTPSHSCAQALKTHIFTPLVMARINAKTGQENDALYLSYALLHAFTQAAVKDPG